MSPKKAVKKIIPKKAFRAIEPKGHLVESFAYNLKSGFPGKGLQVIGVTGTNGKTSTAFMIYKMLHSAGYKTGLITTVAWGVDDDIKDQVEHYTNVPVPQLMMRLKKMKEAGIDFLVMEITSQALAQNRAYGVPFSIVVMTNVTHEHLDYHGTFENYRDAKRKLFKLANKNRQGKRTGIINAEDSSAELFASDIARPLYYGINKGKIKATNVKMTPSGSKFTVKTKDETYNIKTNIPGTFNVYNALATVSVGIALNLTKDQIEKGIKALDGVKGRMNRIDEGQNFDVIVDYAHTPDSFEKLFKDLKPVTKGKLIVMFGSAGRRDEAKRVVQGELAGKYADEVVITEEDDRDMDGEQIMEDIAQGAKKTGKKLDKDLFLVHDRAKAIKFAIGRAKKDDTVLLLGKGHEKSIMRNGPKAEEFRHLKQDDSDLKRVSEDAWDEIGEARKALKR